MTGGQGRKWRSQLAREVCPTNADWLTTGLNTALGGGIYLPRLARYTRGHDTAADDARWSRQSRCDADLAAPLTADAGSRDSADDRGQS